MALSIDDLFPSRYLKAADLKGQRRVLTISKITSEKVGKEQKQSPVVYFQKCTKGHVLNKTNAKKIAEVVGSKFPQDWPGKSVALYPKMVEFGSELVEAIRIDHPTNGAAADEGLAPAAFDDNAGDDPFNADDPTSDALMDDDIPDAPPESAQKKERK